MKGCPFCGFDDPVQGESHTFCLSCGASGPKLDWNGKRWNTRVSVWKSVDTIPYDHAILIKDKLGKVWLVTWENDRWETDGYDPKTILPKNVAEWTEIP